MFTVQPGPGGPQQPVSVLSPLWSILVTGPCSSAYAHLCLRAVRGHEPELDDLLAGFRTYVNAVGAMLVYALAMLVGLVLLVVPGLVAMVRLSFTPFLVVDRDLSPIAAVKTSWEHTRGHGWSLFGLLLVALLILLGGLVLLLIRVVPTLAWTVTAWAAYYGRASTEPAPAGEARPA